MRHRRTRAEATLTVAVPRRPARAEWVLGSCWLGCEAGIRAVLWVGPVSLWGVYGAAQAQLYACEGCLERLYRMALADQRDRDLRHDEKN